MCTTKPTLQEPVKDPARLEWHEACLPKHPPARGARAGRRMESTKAAHHYLSVDTIRKPMQVREDEAPYGKDD